MYKKKKKMSNDFLTYCLSAYDRGFIYFTYIGVFVSDYYMCVHGKLLGKT